MKPYTAFDANEIGKHLINRIKWVPHLRLMTGVDYAAILKEATAAIAEQKIDPAEFKFGRVSSPLRVAGVVDFDKDPLNAARMLVGKGNTERVYEPTDLGKSMPEAVRLVNRLTEIGGRVKISFMAPHTRVDYHEHLDYTYVVHVPLMTDSKVLMAVKYRDGREFFQHYELGSVYLFNSQHQHAVINNSDSPRVHLWCNFGQLKGQQLNTRLNTLIENALIERGLPV